jgi:heparan-alpha-glucosaminide N-acetyltransferase
MAESGKQRATARLDAAGSAASGSGRVRSIDALRGLVMFTMIYVNDLAGVSNQIVPAWMKHYQGKSGMTFVDLVFPAFLFIVGMSIPFALGARLTKGEPIWKILLHVVLRTSCLLFIGILMVNETPDPRQMGWSSTIWSVLMFLSAICAFSVISPPRTADSAAKRESAFRVASVALRGVGLGTLVFLALAFRDKDGHGIISFSPFSIHTEWYGILGLIGWAYLVGSVVFLAFRCNRTALLGCAVLLMCLYPAGRNGAFDHFWVAHYVGIGETIGSQGAITVAGSLLATVLLAPESISVWRRIRFTVLFVAASTAGAWLLNGLYGINKNNATPSWCLWACAITAAVWLILYVFSDVCSVSFLVRPFAAAGQNVLLAYLISEMLPSALDVFQLGTWYDGLAKPGLVHAVARSAGCAVVVLSASAGLNRIGFRLKL